MNTRVYGHGHMHDGHMDNLIFTLLLLYIHTLEVDGIKINQNS